MSDDKYFTAIATEKYGSTEILPWKVQVTPAPQVKDVKDLGIVQ